MKPTRRLQLVWTCCAQCRAKHRYRWSGYPHYLWIRFWGWITKGLPCDE